MKRALLALGVSTLSALGAIACQPFATPPRGPEAACLAACGEHAARCGETACARGCNLVLDRLVEGGDGVVACVARSEGACDDRAWSRCAARVGPHADGGPPAPPPPRDYEDE